MAKHWKSFVKKEKAPKKENAAIDNIASLLSPDAKNSNKSLEDAAEFNSSLKSLIEEQKQLEDQMAELTGKKKKSNTDRKYENEIKTIDEKKKEEAAEEEKRKKRKESHRKKQDDRWEVTPSFTIKRKERDISRMPTTSKKKKKAKPNTDFIQKKKAAKPEVRIPNVKRTPETTIVSKKKKQATTILEFTRKVQKGVRTMDDFTKKPSTSVAKVSPKSQKKPTVQKLSTSKPKTQKPKRQEKTLLQNVNKRNVVAPIQQRKKTNKTVAKTAKKGKEQLNSFVNNPAQKKKVQTVKSTVKKVSKKLGIKVLAYNQCTKMFFVKFQEILIKNMRFYL